MLSSGTKMAGRLDPSAELAELVTSYDYSSLPPAVIRAAKVNLLDTLGTMMAGSASAGSAETARWAGRCGPSGEATVFSFGGRASARDAALANGLMAHALDFDDTHDVAVVHAGTTVVPAALAAAEARGNVSGCELLAAIALGIEVVCRLGLGPLKSPGETGWIYTPLFGGFGACAAVSKILGATTEQIGNGFGLAYAQAAGNNQTVADGSQAKRLQAGLSSSSGVTAAELALCGITGPMNVISGKSGFAALYFGGEFDADRITASIGSEWQVCQLSYKPYPCCRALHGAIDVILDLKTENSIQADDLRRVSIGVSASAQRILGEPADGKRAPRTAVDCQFSLPWVAAVTIVRGRPGIRDFTIEALQDSELRRVAQLVDSYADETLTREGKTILATRVAVETSGGRWEHITPLPYGNPAYPMTSEDLKDKFRSCLLSGVNHDVAARAEDIIGSVQSIEDCADVNSLVEQLS